MKPHLLSLLTLVGFAFIATGCDSASDEGEVTPPPTEFAGRPVDVQGTMYLSSRDVTFYVWDSGLIDGDIISLYIDGRKVIDTYTLTGSKQAFQARLGKESYVLLYAHNEGSVSPNTAAVSIDDGAGERTIVLSADLLTNGAYHLIVR